MRVLVACSTLGSQSETWLYRQIRGMRRVEAHVACHKHLDPERFPFERVIVVPTIHAHRLDLRTWPQRLRNVISGNRFGAKGAPAAAYAAAIHDVKPDVILCHFGRTALLWEPVARRAGVPIVIHFNGIDASAHLRAGKYVSPMKSVLPSVERVVVVAAYMRDNLLQLGYPEDRIHTIPYGTPIEPLVDRKCRPDGDPVTILAVGRLVHKKAPLCLVRAFRRAVDLGAQANLRIIGTGPLEAELRSMVQTTCLEDRVTLLGGIPFERVKQEMQEAHIFAQHSVTGPDGDMEGWPVAIAEAMSYGLPVISTRHAGILDQVTEGETGFLVDEHDSTTMGDRLAELCKNEYLRHAMSQVARKRAVECFDFKDRIAELEEILDLAAT